jgi:hypothetical protein
VAGLGLFAGLVVLFGLWYDGVSSLRGAALVAVALLLILMIATGARLNNRRLADPRQPMVGVPAAEGLADLVSTLEQLSSWRVRDAHLLEVVADRRLGPAVEWGLRRFQNVTWVDNLDSWSLGASAGPSGVSVVLLTPVDDTLSLDEGFVGQDFAIRAFWSPAGLGGQSLIRWIMLRIAATPVSFEHAVLWLEGPQPPEDSSSEQTADQVIPKSGPLQ